MMRPTDPNLFLECVNGETVKLMCSKPLIAEGAWPRQIWVVKFVVDFAVAFLSLQAKVSGGEKFQNLFLTEINFHGNFVCVHLSPQISPVVLSPRISPANFFRQRQFFAGAIFRKRRFSPAVIFAALH